jgi:hypothetical protein
MRKTNDLCTTLVFLLALALLPSTVRAQEPGGNQASAGGSEPASVAPANPASQKADTEEPAGELVGAVRNESAGLVAEAFRYGAEGFRKWDKAKLEATLEMIHEAYARVPIIDEARLAVSVPRTIFGHGAELGVTGWRDLTIDARSRVLGPELALQGPGGIELTAGAYVGNINIEESWGRFAMARVQAERAFGDLELLLNLEHGRIHSDGEPGFLGEGFYHKYEMEGAVPFSMIPGLRHVPGSLAASVEFKLTNFGGEGPHDHEITKIVGYEFPLTGMATKIAHGFNHKKQPERGN